MDAAHVAQISGIEPGFVKDYLTLTLVIGLAVLQGMTYWRGKKAEPSVTVGGSVTTSAAAEYVTIGACERMHNATRIKLDRFDADLRIIQAGRAEDLAKVNVMVANMRTELSEEFREVRKEINTLILAIGRLQGKSNADQA
jgi:hypothetical protein